MTFLDAKNGVTEALKEQLSSRGLVPDTAALERWVNRANGNVWVWAVERNPRAWWVRSADLTFDPVVGSIPYADILNFGIDPPSEPAVYRIEKLWYFDTNDSKWKAMQPLESEDQPLYEPTQPALAPNPPKPTRWYVEGTSIFFTPVPTTSLQVRVTYIPVLQPMGLDSDWLLGGKHQAHHDLVIFKALQLLWKKDDAQATPWDSEVQDGFKDFLRTLRRTQGMRTRRVRRVSHY